MAGMEPSVEGYPQSVEELLLARRSIRKFTEQPINRTEIEWLLNCAILSPSAGNLQPWYFVVIDDMELLKKIKSFSPGVSGQPPCMVLFCLDNRVLPRDSGDRINGDAAIFDLAMAAENLMLAAASRKLGSCAVRSFHPKLVGKILQLPEYLQPELLLTLGYPAIVPPMPPRKPLDLVCCYNHC